MLYRPRARIAYVLSFASSGRDVRCSDELDKKIKISHNKLDESRERLRWVASAAPESGARARERAAKAAEHRLDVVLSRLNQINKHNEGLRSTVEALRKDKIQRAGILRKLVRCVVAGVHGACILAPGTPPR